MASIEKRGENSYRLTACTGYNSQGKKIRKHKSVTLEAELTPKQAEKELQRLSTLFEEEISKGTYLDASRITFAEFCEQWMTKYAEQELEPKTVARYKELLTLRIIPALGHIKLQKLQPTNLIDFYSNLKEAGIRLDTKYTALPSFKELLKEKNLNICKLVKSSNLSDKTISNALKGLPITTKSAEAISASLQVKLPLIFLQHGDTGTLSVNTILHHHRLISSILQDAVEWQLILSNPAERVKSPKSEKKKQRHYNTQQTKDLINALASEPIKFKTMIILDAFTGLRCGEFMGLDWSDLDLENGTLNVNKVSQYISGMGTFTKDKPKNYHSIRTMSIPPFVVSLLKQYKAWWNEQKLACGKDIWQNSNRLFITCNGRPLFTYTLTNWLPKFLEIHNLPKLTPHGIRHTFASLLAKKISIPKLSGLLGHARPSTTDIYIHGLLEESDNNAGNMLEDMLIEKEIIQQKQG